jgi:hypothetical protein
VAITPLVSAKIGRGHDTFRYQFQKLAESSVRVTNMHSGAAPASCDDGGVLLYNQIIAYIVSDTTCVATSCANRIWCR